jgi:dihydroorotase
MRSRRAEPRWRKRLTLPAPAGRGLIIDSRVRAGMDPPSRAVPRERSREEPEFVLAGRAWYRGRLQPVEVGFGEHGRIVAVGRNVAGRRRRDLGESVLIPSATDGHVHFRDPGPTGGVENFASGTLQAVLGGVGTVADMPNTDPPTTSVDRLESKAARVLGRAACDVLLFATARRPMVIRSLGRHAGAFKLYGSPTTGFETATTSSEWPGRFASTGATDLPISVHAEAPEQFVGASDSAKDLVAWDVHRPVAAERTCVDSLLRTAGTARLHVAHVTNLRVAAAVRSAGFSFEVTPHHLLLSTGSSALGALGKVNPPLRSESQRLRLWEAFRAGRIPILASDHAPHPLERKLLPFDQSPSGMPGVETMVPLLLSLVARGELALPVLQSASSERPARWFGLPTGRLAPGHRGHVYAVNFRRKVRLRGRDLHAPAGWTAFEGREAVFPTDHYLDGRPVVRDGEYVGTASGRVVRPEFART